MSKHLRQKIAHAIQTTFRSSSSSSENKSISSRSKVSSCCSVSKPQDYEFIPYQPKHSSSNNDYVDLSECHSWSSSSSSYSRDSGISSDTNISSLSSQHLHQLQSTRTHADDSCSFSVLSNVSSIPHDQMNISNFDVTAWQAVPQSFECCHCQCHHHHQQQQHVTNNEMINYLYVPETYREKRTKHEIFPFFF